MTWIAGVDGCSGGWIAAFRNRETGRVVCSAYPRFAEVLDSRYRPSVVAVDIPIGLPPTPASGRATLEIRRLATGRASSVFPAPIRPGLRDGGLRCGKRPHQTHQR